MLFYCPYHVAAGILRHEDVKLFMQTVLETRSLNEIIVPLREVCARGGVPHVGMNNERAPGAGFNGAQILRHLILS